MADDPYRKLAERLDAIPNGFPATESGVELKLLAKIFTPEEASLAAVMRLTKEPAASIGARAGWSPQEASQALKTMARKGLILAGKGKGELVFGLMPFVVGVYEEQLPRLDQELATLFEQYYQETGGGGALMEAAPPGHRVIPVEQAVAFEPEIFPYERASELLLGAKAWGVRDCICRVQQRLVGKGCDRPVEVCLVFAPVERAFDHSDVTRAITKEEALRILRETEEAGLVHSTSNFRDGAYYICNCCSCCCGFLRSVVEFAVPTAIAHSDFRVVVEQGECVGCAECVERCQFGALSVPDDLCLVDYGRCVGCGQCVTVCPSEALRLERRPESEEPSLPQDRKEWMVRRSEARGINLSEVLLRYVFSVSRKGRKVIAFGPVPSRRLGRSLGINNVPPKVCSYSCVYCQLGRTIKMSAERQEFYRPEDVLEAAREKVEKAQQSGEPVDYLSFVPDGEPTLDRNLGQEIDLLRSLATRVAVISNSSLVWREDVRDELSKADWVSLKVDSTRVDTWREIDRPHGSLKLDSILQGMEEFAVSFEGQLVTETMLVRGVNDGPEQLAEVAAFISQLAPSIAYLSVPTRPPAEDWVQVPADDILNQAYQVFCERLDHVEYLIAYEGHEFAFTGQVQEDLLGITSVHPMRRDAVEAFLSKAEEDWSVVERLLQEGLLAETEYSGATFYLRRFR